MPPVFAESMYERNIKGPRRWREDQRDGISRRITQDENAYRRMEVRELSKGHGSHKLRRVIRASVGEVPRFARDDRVVCLAAIPKAAVAGWDLLFSMRPRSQREIASHHADDRSEISNLDFFVKYFARIDRFHPPISKTNITGIIRELTRSHYCVRPLICARAARTPEPRQLRCNWLVCVIICLPARSAESLFKLFAHSNSSAIIRRPKFSKPT